MNSEYLAILASYIGFAILVLGSLCVLGLLYIFLGEIVKKIGQRMFFPVWVWNIILVCSALNYGRRKWYIFARHEKPTCGKDEAVRYLYSMLDRQEERYPEFAGLVDSYIRSKGYVKVENKE